jgi:hypothetical protein
VSSSAAGLSATSFLKPTSAYVSIRQHTSAYVRIRQHTSAYVRIRAYVSHTLTDRAVRDLFPEVILHLLVLCEHVLIREPECVDLFSQLPYSTPRRIQLQLYICMYVCISKSPNSLRIYVYTYVYIICTYVCIPQLTTHICIYVCIYNMYVCMHPPTHYAYMYIRMYI